MAEDCDDKDGLGLTLGDRQGECSYMGAASGKQGGVG